MNTGTEVIAKLSVDSEEIATMVLVCTVILVRVEVVSVDPDNVDTLI